MNLSRFLEEQSRFLIPEKEVVAELTHISNGIKKELTKALSAKKIRSSVFIGGSFAKGTLLKAEEYDVDLFVRFSVIRQSNQLEKILGKIARDRKMVLKKIHGSRDYYQLQIPERKYHFEIIPVALISNPKKAENVTDLSYFHVSYVQKKIRGLARDVLLAKAFFQAQGVYGAESYIQGFSGYGAECLIIHYRGFMSMIKAFAQNEGQSILDPARHYRNPQEILLSINESKRKGPIVLIDPTFKERNVLAALSRESFDICRKAARSFLKKPSKSFFLKTAIKPEDLKKQATRSRGELIRISLTTDRQEGDIAGTKLKRYSKFVESVLGKRFVILKSLFDYPGEREAYLFLVTKSKGSVLIKGPPISMATHVGAFRKKHSGAQVKKGSMYAFETTRISAKKYLESKLDDSQAQKMGITSLTITSL